MFHPSFQINPLDGDFLLPLPLRLPHGVHHELLEQGGAPQGAGEGQVSLGGSVDVVDELVRPEPTQLALHLMSMVKRTCTRFCQNHKSSCGSAEGMIHVSGRSQEKAPCTPSKGNERPLWWLTAMLILDTKLGRRVGGCTNRVSKIRATDEPRDYTANHTEKHTP